MKTLFIGIVHGSERSWPGVQSITRFVARDLARTRPPARQEDPKQAVEWTEAGATGGLAQHRELIPQGKDFQDQLIAFAKSGSRRRLPS
jgi:hypothetical protein